MRGLGGIYEHVTPETKERILALLQARWESSLLALRPQEQAALIALLPRMEETIKQLTAVQQAAANRGAKIIAQISPIDACGPAPQRGGRASDLRFHVVGDTGIEPVTSTVSR
ncbi:hypothetical protein GCM10023191_023180 [Actinoallomurus oryzae]|uniref:Uncharacterized protein n=1 Tax=Actinoallomurus oryzae TaxID=502180 RepID=A0ABP8PQG2_9ACTN